MSNDPSAFKEHYQKYHGTTFNYSCEPCDKKFKTKRQYTDHQRNSHRFNFTCEICGKKYKLKPLYEGHMNLHKGIRPYPCHFCGKAFTLENNCNAHMAKLHSTEYAEFRSKKQSAKEEKRHALYGINKIFYNFESITGKKKKKRIRGHSDSERDPD